MKILVLDDGYNQTTEIALKIGARLKSCDHVIISSVSAPATANMLRNMASLLDLEAPNVKFMNRKARRASKKGKTVRKPKKYETVNEGFGHRPYGSR